MSIKELETDIVNLAVTKAKRSMMGVFFFSFVANLLLLTSPLFMLQVYDRVLLSRSGSTLLGLLAVAVFSRVVLLVLEVARNYLLNRISVRFDNDLAAITFSEVMNKGAVSKPIHDMNTIRGFLNAPFLLALFDVPWLPAFLGLVYLLHPMLGHIGLAGAIVLFILALTNDYLTRDSSQKSADGFGAANAFVEHSARNKDAVVGMGMIPSLSVIWSMHQGAGLGYHIRSADRNVLISAVAKVVRQLIQVAVLAMGAYLVIQDITTAGVMIAASIIIGRALAPVEQSIQGWRALRKVKESYRSLSEFLSDYTPPKPSTPLPAPKGTISLTNVVSMASSDAGHEQGAQPVIKNISCKIEAGESVGITGPSGSGKSTLARLMIGVVRPLNGSIKIDGAELSVEVQRQYAHYIGYLPQTVELFEGTIAENIARFKEGDPQKVVDASNLAKAHDLIVGLPEGYETKVGPSGLNLSGGQRQRIGLARALYDSPPIVVLDEPSSNLDNDGRLALMAALKSLKEMQKTVILIGHQPSLFVGMDKVALVAAGQLQNFGPADEVIAELKPRKIVIPEKKVSSSRPPSIKQIRKS